MQKLNFNHLYYFWAVARLGTVSEASRELGVSQPAVSTQIKALERTLGVALFRRTGRRMELTPIGHMVSRHTEEMFRISDDLVRAVADGLGNSPGVLAVGAADAVPKIIVRAILSPILKIPNPPVLVCREWRTDLLLAELSVHRLDLVITDAPVRPTVAARTVSHMMGQSPIGIYGAKSLARRYRDGFPRCLDGAPFVLPTDSAALRVLLNDWFEANGIRPRIVAEAEDRALLHHFAEDGFGLIPAARVIQDDIRRQFGVVPVGVARGVREHYYAVAVQRATPHPAVAAICAAAKRQFEHLA